MAITLKLVGLFLLQLFSLGVLIVEEEYLMFVCVILIVLIVSVVAVDLIDDWLEGRRFEIWSLNRTLNKKLMESLKELHLDLKVKEVVKKELEMILLLERNKGINSRSDLGYLSLDLKRSSYLRSFGSRSILHYIVE